MSKGMKITLIIGAVLFVFVVLPFIILSFVLTGIVTTVGDIVSPAYSDEDVINYVKDTHGFKVNVLENEGRDPTSFGSLVMRDATVERVDGLPVTFTVFINSFGKISGDNYEDVVARQNLNNELKQSMSYRELEHIGFSNIQFGEDESRPVFLMSLPDDLDFGDEATLHMLYDSLPILKEWQEKAAEENVELDVVSIDGLQLDLEKQYSSWTDLANQLAADNIGDFTYQFLDADKAKLEEIDEELHQLEFSEKSSSNLTCVEMKEYDTCASYDVTLYPLHQELHDRYFQHDNEQDKENLFKAIQFIQKIDLPIKNIHIAKIRAPKKQEDQKYTMEELEERDGPNPSLITGGTITRIYEIHSIDDLYFEY